MNAEADTSFGQRQYDRDRDIQNQQMQWNQREQFRNMTQTLEFIVQSFRPTLQLQASALKACADGLNALAHNLEQIERNIQTNQPQQQQRNVG